MTLIQELKHQNAKLLARVEPPEAFRSVSPHERSLLPATYLTQQKAETVDAKLSKKIIPSVKQQIQQFAHQMTKLRTDTAEKTVHISTSRRISAIALTLIPDHARRKPRELSRRVKPCH